MFNYNNKKNHFFHRNEPGLDYFKSVIGSSEHTFRQGQVNSIHTHLLRNHDVLRRKNLTYTFKGKTFEPA
ncbi:MAG: hypothetical protein J6J23_00850, partial [Clostridia bacterium]|nr:hypothetical protein [Clostridia bacterium]